MVRLVVGLALLGAAVLDFVALQQRAEDIRAHHTTVDAEVMGLRGIRHYQTLRVEYVYRDRAYRADLLDIGWGLPPGAGEHLTLAIDPDRPSQAAGPDLVSGSPWRYWYQHVGVAGIAILLTAAWGWVRGRRRGELVAVARTFVHPSPAWPERADGTIKTMILVPGNTQLPREEELPVRRIDADTAEICCVPFLQMRLALGDVVHVNGQGYTGAVIHPSGRVTFAVRYTDPALIDELTGTVVERIGDGLFAIAATAEDADRIHARLRSWEEDGRVEYRSILRTDQFDEPLL
jgi:hypothetical protein